MICALAFFEIVVNNFDVMLEWYTQILGFRLKGEIIFNEDGRWCQLMTSDGDGRLALWKPSDPSKTPDPGGKIRPSFFPIFEVQDLYSFVERLKASKKVKMLEPIRERVGYRITTIADPEENQLQLYEKRI
ncbi:VOC family protein [bacterium]|nr:MAG: VOC family protein [bacterium]